MKKSICAAAAIAMTAVAGTAGAADLPRSGPYYSAPAPSTYSWAGWYAGVNLGYQWGKTTNNPTRPSGLQGGVQGGYNWQTGQFVFGGETDLQVSGADDTFAPWKFSNTWYGTLRGRLGYAYNNILLFASLGIAYGGVKGESGFLSESKTHTGWAAGAGLEVGLTPNWSARAEYLYVDLSDRSYSITGANNGLESNILRFGVNYRF